MNAARSLLYVLAMSLGAVAAHAQSVPAPLRADVLTLDAQVSSEVQLDMATLTLVTESEGRDAAQVAQRVNQTLDETLKEAKAESRVSARSGGYRTFPTTDKEGRIAAWRARAEIVLESGDFSALSALAGRLSSRMQVAGIAFALAPETRRMEEDRLITQAIARFQSRAQIAAKAFGYASYSVLEVAVNAQASGGIPPRPMLRSAMSAEASPVPVEPGRTTVTVHVSGSVKLQK